jgi:hypothetical protein
LSITADGPTTASYTLYLTDASGQAVDGVFADTSSPQVQASISFNTAGTQTFTYRVKGPYSYPDSVTARVNVNSQSWSAATVSCK